MNKFEAMKLYLGSYFAFFTSGREHWVEVEISNPIPLTQILSELGVPAGEVHLVVVNNALMESTDTVISDGDIVRLYPALGGG